MRTWLLLSAGPACESSWRKAEKRQKKHHRHFFVPKLGAGQSATGNSCVPTAERGPAWVGTAITRHHDGGPTKLNPSTEGNEKTQRRKIRQRNANSKGPSGVLYRRTAGREGGPRVAVHTSYDELKKEPAPGEKNRDRHSVMKKTRSPVAAEGPIRRWEIRGSKSKRCLLGLSSN